MAPNHLPSCVDAIVEAPEHESVDFLKGIEAEEQMNFEFRKLEPNPSQTMSMTRVSADRHKDKARKSHRSSTGSSANRHTVKGKSKTTTPSRRSVSASRDHRHQRVYMNKEEVSSNSEDEGGYAFQYNQESLAAARGRLTSPSLLSTLTSLTTATNYSGSSSGSNSTVTQASITKSSQQTPEASPVSPAVPDAPDVFAYLEKDDCEEDDETDADRDHHRGDYAADGQWSTQSSPDFYQKPLSQHHVVPLNSSVSSSGSSSFHSDSGASEKPIDNDTDRSTSPERSIKGEDEPIKGEDSVSSIKPDPELPTDPSAAKIASQILAAQQRQTLHARHASQPRGVSFTPQPTAVHVHRNPSQPHLRRSPPQQLQPPPRPRTILPNRTGYDVLATKLSESSSSSSDSPTIKPIYRQFSFLNHRLLLHLQDELCELEEKLYILDQNDTQARTIVKYPSTDTKVLPASRRTSAHAGGEFEWYKMDLMNRISMKLGQYNAAMKAFLDVRDGLGRPESGDVEEYKTYLEESNCVVETERKFLDVREDLAVVSSSSPSPNLLHSSKKSRQAIQSSSPPSTLTADLTLSLACLLAAAVLIPILTFTVIPGYLGRMVVVLLVALGIVASLVQAGVPGMNLLTREKIACALVYGALMAVVAGIVG